MHPCRTLEVYCKSAIVVLYPIWILQLNMVEISYIYKVSTIFISLISIMSTNH